MFGPAGFAYIYVIYGMHHCLNAITEPEGYPAAVLIRAVQPCEGIELMRSRRRKHDMRQLASGPGRLCQAFGVSAPQNGADLVGPGELHVEAGWPVADGRVAAGPRVGITVAVDRPWRFVVTDSPFLSRPSGAAR